MRSSLFTGTFRIVKLLFQQNRFRSMIWLTGIVGVSLATATAYKGVYQSEEDIRGFALTMNNPAMQAMLGPGYEMGKYNLGALFANEMLLFTGIAAAVMNILLTGSSTRNDEEEGRLEMLLALPVGRLAYSAAAIILSFILNFLLVVLLGLSLSLVGNEGMSLEACFLYGLLIGGTGQLFAALTACYAQLAASSRGVTGLSFAALIAFYLIRAIGDVSSDTLALFSPLGWIVRAEVFVTNRNWPIFALMAAAVILLLLALYLNLERDLYAGLLPVRKGRKTASAFLKKPWGLVLDLEKTQLLYWTAGLFLMSASFGSILGDLESYFAEMPFVEQVLGDANGQSLQDQFTSLLFEILSLFTAAPAVITILKLLKEEKTGRIENVYSRSVSRTTMLTAYLGTSVLAVFLMQLMIAVGYWVAAPAEIRRTMELLTTIGWTLAYIPAVLVFVGLAVFLIGTVPHWANLVWGYFTLALLIMYLHNLLDFPDFITNLSSFTYVPEIGEQGQEWLPLVPVTLLSLILAALGFRGYNRRDMQWD